jgi:hypothetical protein
MSHKLVNMRILLELERLCKLELDYCSRYKQTATGSLRKTATVLLSVHAVRTLAHVLLQIELQRCM